MGGKLENGLGWLSLALELSGGLWLGISLGPSKMRCTGQKGGGGAQAVPHRTCGVGEAAREGKREWWWRKEGQIKYSMYAWNGGRRRMWERRGHQEERGRL